MTHKILTCAFISFCLLLLGAIAQPPQNMPDGTVNAETRTAVIDNLIRELNDGYVFPETAKKMQADLEKRRSGGEYDSITSSQAFAKKLTEDLLAVSKDKHPPRSLFGRADSGSSNAQRANQGRDRAAAKNDEAGQFRL